MRQILWVWMLVMMTLVSVNIERYHCCLEEERTGLMELKAWINHPDGISLPDWVENTEDTDCCKWYGVKCDNTTNRVTELDLSFERDDWRLGDLYLNASLFLPFKELKSLGLASNKLVGCFENQGLRKLEELHVRANRFNDSVLASLSGLSSLKILDLSDNMNLIGSTGINGLRNLKILYLNGIDIKGSVLIESLAAIPSLKTFSAIHSNLNRALVDKG
ncbi:unnamed protein product [Dovyalis caffra]|uniref:Leucine-rich repeat-containing N-terminal plant-type domain-containing protein n=1 Tax=Dovyalis caffra TaxID=77055 RepID=A0AAV1RW87_9ROSI|nr:unnamed protein product [Dovyalis caffra]